MPANEGIWTVEDQASDAVALPPDFLEAKLVVYNSRPLERISDLKYLTWSNTSNAAGETKHFARIGGDIFLYKPPDTTATFSMVYWRDFSGQLVNDTDTNEILRIAPDLYVYGALLEATPYLGQDERLEVWNDLFNQAFEQINQQASEAEYAGSIVSVANAYGDSRHDRYGGR